MVIAGFNHGEAHSLTDTDDPSDYSAITMNSGFLNGPNNAWNIDGTEELAGTFSGSAAFIFDPMGLPPSDPNFGVYVNNGIVYGPGNLWSIDGSGNFSGNAASISSLATCSGPPSGPASGGGILLIDPIAGIIYVWDGTGWFSLAMTHY